LVEAVQHLGHLAFSFPRSGVSVLPCLESASLLHVGMLTPRARQMCRSALVALRAKKVEKELDK
jgi:hypothetical protein